MNLYDPYIQYYRTVLGRYKGKTDAACLFIY